MSNNNARDREYAPPSEWTRIRLIEAMWVIERLPDSYLTAPQDSAHAAVVEAMLVAHALIQSASHGPTSSIPDFAREYLARIKTDVALNAARGK